MFGDKPKKKRKPRKPVPAPPKQFDGKLAGFMPTPEPPTPFFGSLPGAIATSKPAKEDPLNMLKRSEGSRILQKVVESSKINFVVGENHQPKQVKPGELKQKCLKVIEPFRGSTKHSWIVHPLNLWEIFDMCHGGLFMGFPVRVSVNANPRCLGLFSIEALDELYPLED